MLKLKLTAAITTAAITTAIAIAPPATAADIWTFAENILSDGGVLAANSFFEEDGGRVVNWAISLSGGCFVSTGATYTPNNSYLVPLSPSRFLLAQLPASATSHPEARFADFSFRLPLATPDLANSLNPGSREYRLANGRGQTRSLSGTATQRIQSVPEPSTVLGSFAVLGLGIALKKAARV